jgi:hypothetical protein
MVSRPACRALSAVELQGDERGRIAGRDRKHSQSDIATRHRSHPFGVGKQLGFTRTAVARAMGVSQSALSQLESQDDLQLSTLRRLVHALGGELDLVARFGHRSIILSQSDVS